MSRPSEGGNLWSRIKIHLWDPIKIRFWIFAPIFAYILLSTAVACALILTIHGHAFRNPSTEDFFQLTDGSFVFLPLSGLRQSDVTTLVSFAATITRAIGAYCCGIACWRTVYILLEKTELTLSDLDHLVSWPILLPWPWGTHRVVVSIITFLFLSAGLYSPILNGSISWQPGTILDKDYQLSSVTKSGVSRWDFHSIFFSERQGIVYQAVGQAMTALGNGRSNAGGHFNSALWRVVNGVEKLPINSTIANITVPFFVIDSFEWIVDPDATLDSVTLQSVDFGSDRLNYTSPLNPMQQSEGGIIALLPRTSWAATATPQEPTVIKGDHYVAIKIGTSPQAIGCNNKNSSVASWGPWPTYVPPNVRYYHSNFTEWGTAHCVAFARVSLRAGVGTCQDCPIIAPSVVRNNSQIDLIPDLMTEETFHVLPEVSVAITRTNKTLISPLEGLDRYIIDTLTQAYCSSWTAVNDYFGKVEPKLETRVKISSQVLEAKVNRTRVVIWLLLNSCIAAVCIVIVFVQASTFNQRVLVHSTLAAVLLDATEVVDHLSKDPGLDKVLNRSCLSDKNMATLVGLKAGEGNHRLVPRGHEGILNSENGK